MALVLIGMSNSGKTYWSKKLKEEKNYYYFSCDDYIQKKLNLSSINDLNLWLGFPYEEKYQKNSQIYLNYEEESIKKAIQIIKNNHKKKLVIDTTGSIVHLHSKYLKKLSSIATLIYLKINNQEIDQMIKLYFKNPKPLIWGKFFKQEKNKDPIQQIKEQYPKLLRYRQQIYRKFAHIVLSSFELREKNTDFFLNKIIKNFKKND